jgi:hypothetical protein
MGRVEVDDGAGFRAMVVHGGVEEGLLGGLVAGDVAAGGVEFRDRGGVEVAEGGAGWRHQPAAVCEAGGDVASGAVGEATLEQR